MAYCKFCKSEIPENAAFCTRCGKSQDTASVKGGLSVLFLLIALLCAILLSLGSFFLTRSVASAILAKAESPEAIAESLPEAEAEDVQKPAAKDIPKSGHEESANKAEEAAEPDDSGKLSANTDAESTPYERALHAYTNSFEKYYLPDEYGSYRVALAYLDEDEIPEMIVLHDGENPYRIVLQYVYGKTAESGYLGQFSYVPHRNRILEVWQNDEDRGETLYAIQNHKLTDIANRSIEVDDAQKAHYYRYPESGDREELSQEAYEHAFDAFIDENTFIDMDMDDFSDSVSEAEVLLKTQSP